MTTQGSVRGGCSPAKKGVQTPAPVRPLSIEENERRVYEVGGPHRLSILRRVLSVSCVRQATKLPDLYIRIPLSIGAELCSGLPRIHLPRTSMNRVRMAASSRAWLNGLAGSAMDAAPEWRTEMCPSCGLSHSSAEGQRRASHSLCELGTTRSLPPCRRRTG